MITQEQINKLTNFELDKLIKMVRVAQKKQEPIVLEMFKNFTEPEKNYTLEDLYNIYADKNRGEKVSISKSSFNRAITRYLNDGTLKLKNIKIKQVKPIIDKKKNKQLIGDIVDNVEK